MKLPRIMIAAPKSGSGKTMITCALLELLREYLETQGRKLSAFKCGPDYIDPMFHREIIGVPSRNLDCFFSEEDQIKELFAYGQTENGVSVIEGVMGLYDGLGGVSEEASSYHLAGILKAPIVLVVDAKGMGRSVLPLLAGFLAYDRGHLIKGVILNRVSRSFGQNLQAEIERELKLPVLGCFPEQNGLMLESRHLGLKLPGEVEALRKRVREAADILKQNVDWEQILALADAASEWPDYGMQRRQDGSGEGRVRIGVAQDEAFCFYYEDNLRILREMGAELVPFSPLRDAGLPDRLDGLLLGGGYPELWLPRLSENTSMQRSIREALERGMPSIAECGGFLYLHDKLEDQNGIGYPMCGVIPGTCRDTGRSVRFGYVTLTLNSENNDRESGENTFLTPGQHIRAHEFHYYDSPNNGNACRAVKPLSGRAWECIHAGEVHWWGFPHLYFPSNPQFARNFIAAAIAYKNCLLRKNVR